jgi:ATP-binding cassette subfamily B protein
VLDALDRLSRGRTSIIVSHRLGALRDADQIFVLQGGGVGARGTHEELLKSDEWYARSFALQEGAEPGPEPQVLPKVPA